MQSNRDGAPIGEAPTVLLDCDLVAARSEPQTAALAAMLAGAFSASDGPELARRLELKKIVVALEGEERSALRLALMRAGYAVRTTDGASAMRAALEFGAELVVTDFGMSRMSGYELVRSLRAVDATRAVPLVLFASAGSRRALAGLPLGRCRLLEPPCAASRVVEACADLIGPGVGMALLGRITEGGSIDEEEDRRDGVGDRDARLPAHLPGDDA